MVGKLEVYVGSMFAEKSTNLLRQGKRHIFAGRKVVFIKPKIDNRYSDSSVVTHDGVEHKAINVEFDNHCIEDFSLHTEVIEADVICIDEVQFFPRTIILIIEELIYKNKKVYVAGLDMDRFGEPFGVVPYLMAKAEVVKKFNAVCNFCGNDAWVSLATEDLENDEQIKVGNGYVPACRTCADKVGGIK